MSRYENRALLNLAHQVNECQLRLPEICQGYAPDGCEPAHSNQARHGKGGSIKAHDCFHAAACHACHAEIDQGNTLMRDEKEQYMQAAMERTMLLYFRNGWLKVKK